MSFKGITCDLFCVLNHLDNPQLEKEKKGTSVDALSSEIQNKTTNNANSLDWCM